MFVGGLLSSSTQHLEENILSSCPALGFHRNIVLDVRLAVDLMCATLSVQYVTYHVVLDRYFAALW